jgi:hypothetical protein
MQIWCFGGWMSWLFTTRARWLLSEEQANICGVPAHEGAGGISGGVKFAVGAADDPSITITGYSDLVLGVDGAAADDSVRPISDVFYLQHLCISSGTGFLPYILNLGS